MVKTVDSEEEGTSDDYMFVYIISLERKAMCALLPPFEMMMTCDVNLPPSTFRIRPKRQDDIQRSPPREPRMMNSLLIADVTIPPPCPFNVDRSSTSQGSDDRIHDTHILIYSYHKEVQLPLYYT